MIFLQGGKGFLGSAIAKELKKNNFKFKIITKQNYKIFKKKKCKIFINASTNSRKYLSKNKDLFDFNNTVLNIKRSIVDFSFSKYILVSSCEVYNNKNNPKYNSEHSFIDPQKLSNYGFNKYLAELIVKKECKSWLILRCNGLIGDKIKKGPIYDIKNNSLIWSNPDSQYQFINIIDVARVIIRLIKTKRKNQVFNLSGESFIKIKNIIKDYHFKNKKYKANIKKEIYNINIRKIKKFYKIKKTQFYVKDFFSMFKIFS
jgi:nucleoside-diphosphate-sugar epimerase